MMHTRRRKWPWILGVLATAGGITMMVGCHRKSPEARIDHVSQKIASHLDFNDQQKVLLDEIANELKKDMTEAKSRRGGHKEVLKTMLLSPELDKAKVIELMKERNEFIEARKEKYLDKIAALHKSLSPKQKKNILSKLEKFEHHWN